MLNKKIIAIDFDGTIVESQDFSPEQTDFVLMPNAKEVMDWVFENFYVIIWTCRDDVSLQNAVKFLSVNSIQFHTINQNIPGLDFETSAKIYYDFLVDDHASTTGIDWLQIKDFLTKQFLQPQYDDNRLITKVVKLVIEE